MTPEQFTAKLAQLTATQDSITSTAQWVLFHHRHHATIVSTWESYIQSHQKQALALIYLANEVVQQARAKGKKDLLTSFGGILQKVIDNLQLGSSDMARVGRVVDVWRDRKIFDNEIVMKGTKSISSHQAPAASQRSSSPTTVLTPSEIINFFQKTYHTSLASNNKGKIEHLSTSLNETIKGLLTIQDELRKSQLNAVKRAEVLLVKQKEVAGKLQQAKAESQNAISSTLISDGVPGYSPDSDDSDDYTKRKDSDSDSSDEEDDKADKSEQPKKKLRFSE